MKKIISFIIVLVCAFGFFSCQKKASISGLPLQIKIIKKGGISILPKPQSGVKGIAVAPQDYTYKVLGGFPGYYKITFINGKEGWIPAGQASKWTEQQGNKVKILLKGGITVRSAPYDSKSESIGVAASMYSFDILETSYIYFKIEYPEKKEGWVYAGKPGDMWVEPANSEMTAPNKTESMTTTNKSTEKGSVE